jgi:4-hydroxymandelate oxidase
MVLSSNAAATFAEVAATGADWWLQAYLPQDRSLLQPVLAAAVEAGCKAVVLTADTPVVATKVDGGGPSVLGQVPRRWLRTNLGTAADAPKAQDLGAGDVAWLRDVTGLPVVVKGVLRADDARACADSGAAAVWVSNHGGRQLDRSVSTASRLAGVADAVSGGCEVYVDGGVRDGLGVLTALALGADAVFLGRLPLWALAVDGSAGIERMFFDLESEVVEALKLAGSTSPGSVRDVVGVEFE